MIIALETLVLFSVRILLVFCVTYFHFVSCVVKPPNNKIIRNGVSTVCRVFHGVFLCVHCI